MVGVVGSSPIAPTNGFPGHSTTRNRQHGYDTADVHGDPIGQRAIPHARCSTVSMKKCGIAPALFCFPESRDDCHQVARRRRPSICRTGLRPRRRGGDRPRPRQGGAGRQGRRQDRRLVVCHRSRREPRDRHREGSRGPRSDPPLGGAPPRLRCEGALSRRAGDHRSGHRGRVLLRFLVQAPVHAGRPRRHRTADGANSRKRTSRSCAPKCRATTR